MNIDIVDSLEKTLEFLNKIHNQLSQYNAIDVDSLKLLCYIVYKQKTNEEQKEIEYPLITVLSFINKDTKVYNNEKIQVTDCDIIFNNYINTSIKDIFGD